ncbi:Na(+)-translocating NADH-quinone reductase subunit A [Portibacter marinus]|uniref:Na(+)-translocating NADH-quinone reductase subunit A n=1 Tax=Portibacter marinus TaxID=2898660 RepID=UPI001F3C3D20|nr:Na(+)-translocating NADH-quinone reductase subunit A [Portibacter marinus]
MRVYKLTFLLALILFSLPISAQSDSGRNILTMSIIVVGLVVVIGLIISLADNLMQIEAKKNNLDTSKGQFSLFPRIRDWFGPKKPAFVKDAPYHRLTKGFNLNLAGKPKNVLVEGNVKTFAIQPQNFNGMSPIPKVVVEVGDEVAIGDPLFYDKKREGINYVAPVSGEVIEINRGAKRSIASVVILADRVMRHKQFAVPKINEASREDLMAFLKVSGALPLLNQRPYDVVPEDDVVPDNIFISTFDTAPLAPDYSFIAEDHAVAFQEGINVLNKLTDGKVYVGLDGRKDAVISDTFSKVMNAELHYFDGKHPAGNVGIQIHHLEPITTKSKVWTIGVQELISLGRLFLTGKYDAERIVVVGGPQVAEPSYVKTYLGANIGDLVDGNIVGDNNRLISGDALSGQKKEINGFLDFRSDQVTVLQEGDDYELFGWLLPITPRPSISGTFPNALFGDHEFEATTNTHGERRAFVMSGQYESVLPMDIYPVHLMKAIMTGDIEKMEGLGIYELTEEDIAICEFVCTSKQPLQNILREGLDLMQEQG